LIRDSFRPSEWAVRLGSLIGCPTGIQRQGESSKLAQILTLTACCPEKGMASGGLSASTSCWQRLHLN
jgi:hypothetical protein